MAAVNNEFFYWMSIALMMLIHAGFLAYEVGASRSKNVLATAMKNLLALATIVASFFFVGWFLYNAMPSGFIEFNDAAKAALPWGDNMGPNVQDPASGIFWGAFANDENIEKVDYSKVPPGIPLREMLREAHRELFVPKKND